MTPIKPQIIVASIMSLGYNKNVSYPKPITLAKRNLLFYRYNWPYTFDNNR